MKFKGVFTVIALALAVLFSYTTSSAQVVDAVKDAASKTKEVTVDTAKKTKVIVTDSLSKAADKTGDAAAATGSAIKSKSTKFGNTAVNVTENVAGQAYEGGKWFMVTTWDGTKWVTKRTWYATKKAAGATKDAVVGDEDNKP